MDKDDKIFFGFLGSLVILVFTALTIIFMVEDEDYWTEAPDGCFVHTIETHSLFRSDDTATTMLCPIKE